MTTADRGVAQGLAQLIDRYSLSAEHGRRFHRLLELLREEVAPTSVREPRTAIDVHLADSLTALDLDLPEGPQNVVDIGSGAGFPGLPLAISRPHWSVSLLESQSRKCRFIDRAIQATNTENARVIRARAEEWEQGMRSQDLALVRAVCTQPVALEYAAPLLRVGGLVLDWRARLGPDEESDATAAARLLGLVRERVVPVAPFADARHRHLHVYSKARHTPPRFPRRAGIAIKRPLKADTARKSFAAEPSSERVTTSDRDQR